MFERFCVNKETTGSVLHFSIKKPPGVLISFFLPFIYAFDLKHNVLSVLGASWSKYKKVSLEFVGQAYEWAFYCHFKQQSFKQPSFEKKGFFKSQLHYEAAIL